MKKVFSVIFLVLSLLFGAYVIFVGAFCVYNIKIWWAEYLSRGVFDMWVALRIYPKLLISGSLLGLFSNIMYIILSEKETKKTLKAVIFIFFVLILIAAFVLRYFCYRDF